MRGHFSSYCVAIGIIIFLVWENKRRVNKVGAVLGGETTLQVAKEHWSYVIWHFSFKECQLSVVSC